MSRISRCCKQNSFKFWRTSFPCLVHWNKARALDPLQTFRMNFWYSAGNSPLYLPETSLTRTLIKFMLSLLSSGEFKNSSTVISSVRSWVTTCLSFRELMKTLSWWRDPWDMTGPCSLGFNSVRWSTCNKTELICCLHSFYNQLVLLHVAHTQIRARESIV